MGFLQPFCPILLHKLNLTSIILQVSHIVSLFAAESILIITVIIFVVVIISIIIVVRIILTVGN